MQKVILKSSERSRELLNACMLPKKLCPGQKVLRHSFLQSKIHYFKGIVLKNLGLVRFFNIFKSLMLTKAQFI